MGKTFREHHLIQALDGYDPRRGPLDLYLSNYFRENRAIGSKDRRFIGDKIYQMIRWQGLIDHHCDQGHDWRDRYQVLEKLDLNRLSKKDSLPPHIRASFPKNLFNLMESKFGTNKAIELCHASNTPAPTTVRANVLKTTRQHLHSLWQKKFGITLTRASVWGIQFDRRCNFQALPEFKEGFFEVQDEASQLVANLVEARPGDHVLDYCAGAGGKTLAFAHRLQGKGQIFLHDIRKTALEKAKRRLRRAGIENSQIVYPDSSALEKIEGKCDWVLVDAPCSGTGTLRRNPDLKWKFSEKMLEELVALQREIFASALKYLAPKGKIIYATCSLLPQENEEQLSYFQETHRLDLFAKPFQTLPVEDGMDGFFAATLRVVD